MLKICQRYSRNNSEATNSRKLPKAKIYQIYAIDIPGVILWLQIQEKKEKEGKINIYFKYSAQFLCIIYNETAL